MDYPPAKRSVTNLPLAGLRLLLVDDQVDTLDIFSVLLELEGATVLTAASGQQALTLAAAHHFDVLLCDIGMPVMDGYQLINKLRHSGRNGSMAAIALTGFGPEQYAHRASEANFDRHLLKPVRIDEVVRVIQDLLEMAQSGQTGE